jgi:DNA-directed RNA polymerase subunit RPC12/RpoP
MEEDMDAQGRHIECPVCGGEGGYMGTLGFLDWFRCRYCGMDFNRRQLNDAAILD